MLRCREAQNDIHWDPSRCLTTVLHVLLIYTWMMPSHCGKPSNPHSPEMWYHPIGSNSHFLPNHLSMVSQFLGVLFFFLYVHVYLDMIPWFWWHIKHTWYTWFIMYVQYVIKIMESCPNRNEHTCCMLHTCYIYIYIDVWIFTYEYIVQNRDSNYHGTLNCFGFWLVLFGGSSRVMRWYVSRKDISLLEI